MRIKIFFILNCAAIWVHSYSIKLVFTVSIFFLKEKIPGNSFFTSWLQKIKLFF